MNRAAVTELVDEHIKQKRGSLDWLENFELTDEEAEQISDPKWVEPGLLAEGHVIAIVAKPNGGKTTILFDLACQIAPRAVAVVYVHADTNPAEAKERREQAKQCGVRYLTPDMKVGMSMANVVKHLENLARSDTDLAGHVWFFDTFKKMTNVINKTSMRGVLQLMRKLSSRGATCVLVCHTNKYKDDEGNYKYEGTGDLESDVDELIYFEPRENGDGSLTVSTRCVKRRAEIQAMTWEIRPDRSVFRHKEYVDVAAELAKQAQRETDQTVIEAVTEILATGSKKQTEIVTYCRGMKITEKRVRAVLKRWSGDLWTAQRLFEKNAWRYELCAPPAELPNCRTGARNEPF